MYLLYLPTYLMQYLIDIYQRINTINSELKMLKFYEERIDLKSIIFELRVGA